MHVVNPNFDVNEPSANEPSALETITDYVVENRVKVIAASGLAGYGLYSYGPQVLSAVNAILSPSLGNISFFGGKLPVGIPTIVGSYAASKIAGKLLYASMEPILAIKHSCKTVKNKFLTYVGDDKHLYDKERIREMLKKALGRPDSPKNRFNPRLLKKQVEKSKEANPLAHFDQSLMETMFRDQELNYTLLEQFIATGTKQEDLYQLVTLNNIVMSEEVFDDEIENCKNMRLEELRKKIDFPWLERVISAPNSEITINTIYAELVNAEWTGTAEFLQEEIERCQKIRLEEANSKIDFEYLATIISDGSNNAEIQRNLNKIFLELKNFGWPGDENKFLAIIKETIEKMAEKAKDETREAVKFNSYDMLTHFFTVTASAALVGGLIYYYPSTISGAKSTWDSGILTPLAIGKAIDVAAPHLLNMASGAVKYLTVQGYRRIPKKVKDLPRRISAIPGNLANRGIKEAKRLASWGWRKLEPVMKKPIDKAIKPIFQTAANNLWPITTVVSGLASAALYSSGLSIFGDIATTVAAAAFAKSAYDMGTNQ